VFDAYAYTPRTTNERFSRYIPSNFARYFSLCLFLFLCDLLTCTLPTTRRHFVFIFFCLMLDWTRSTHSLSYISYVVIAIRGTMQVADARACTYLSSLLKDTEVKEIRNTDACNKQHGRIILYRARKARCAFRAILFS
jgi:hypothetical protein